jgi:hypothetical protein
MLIRESGSFFYAGHEKHFLLIVLCLSAGNTHRTQMMDYYRNHQYADQGTRRG